LAIGDFNGDGRLDVLATNPGTNTLAILPGVGDGSLLNPETLLLDIQPSAITVGNFTGNSADLAILDQFTGIISVYVPDNTGGFIKKVNGNGAGREVPLQVDPTSTGIAAAALIPGGSLDL